MSPRASAAQAARTREEIVRAAVAQASTDGLEGVTFGTLAQRLEMSKAGVVGPFGTKERLQLEAIEAAVAVFRREVWEPASEAEAGMPRLLAIVDAWIAHLIGGSFPGGCFLTQAAADFDGRPGPVRDEVRRTAKLWEDVLARDAATAVERGDLARDPRQVAFEIGCFAQGLNQAVQLQDDPEAPERARRAMLRALEQDFEQD